MKVFIALAVLVSTASACMHPRSLRTSQGSMTLYEGNGGSQGIVCNLRWFENEVWNFKDNQGGCQNDEARSVIIHEAKAGTVISFYDSPTGKTSDDYVIIKVKQEITSDIILDSFEASKNTPYISVTYHHKNGLDGKVSRATVEAPSLPMREEGGEGSSNGGDMALYKEVGGTGGVVCDLEWDGNKNWDFSQGQGGCNGKEVRSLKIKRARAGQTIILSDSPSVTGDKLVISIIRDIVSPVTIDSLEETFQNENMIVMYRHSKGLVGRLAYVDVEKLPLSGSEGEMELYVNNGPSGSLLCKLTWSGYTSWDFQQGQGGCSHTNARSLIIRQAEKGTIINFSRSVYSQEAFAKLIIRKSVTPSQPLKIPSFQTNISNGHFYLAYHGNEDLDGHVTYVNIAG